MTMRGGIGGLLLIRPASTTSQTVARPQRARFQCRDDLLGEIRTAQPAIDSDRAQPRLRAAEPTARGRHQWRDDIVAEALAQCRAQIAYSIGDAELDRLAAGPELTGEHVIFGAGEPRSPALLHQRNEILVNLVLHRFEPRHVLRLLRQEPIEHRLAVARRVEPPLDAYLLHQPGEAEGAADYADRAHDGRGVADDLIGGAGDHVA